MIPRIAIIDQNILEATGLKSILCDMVPMADVSTFCTLDDLLREEENSDESVRFVHYFVSAQVLVAHADYFLSRQRQTIVLTSLPSAGKSLEHFRVLNTSQMEHDLLRHLLSLFQQGHGSSDKRPLPMPMEPNELSPREVEVLSLVVRGFINKEIADRLCISLPTVVTHRKNICDKLRLRSVSALTIYAVTHGIVTADEI